MADNTTTYTTIIDTQVKGTEDVKNMGDAVEEQDKKFVSLRRQIRETTVALQAMADQGKQGTKEFKDLSNKLDDLQDQQKRVAFQSAQIEDKLAALPGPIGQIGKSLQGAKESIDTFGKGITVALGAVGLIITAILSFKEALSRTEEGQKKLNKISEAFEKILNGLFAIIEPIANAFADLVTNLLSSEKTMKVLATTAGVLSATFTTLFGVVKELAGFIINNFVNSFKTLIGVASAAGKVLKGVFTFDFDLIKEGVAEVGTTVKKGFTSFVDNVKDTAKGVGKAVVEGVTTGFDQGANAFREGQKRLTKEQREKAKKDAEELKKNQEALQKQIDEYNRGAANADKSAREKELAENKQKYDELVKAAQKYHLDITALNEGFKQKEGAINRKYDKVDIEENIKKLDEIAKNTNFKFQQRIDALNGELAKEKDLLDKGLITQAEYADRVSKIEADKRAVEKEKRQKDREEKLLEIENEIATVGDSYNRRIAMVNEKEKLMLAAAKQAKATALADETLSEDQRVKIVSDADAKIKQITEEASAERLGIQKERYDERITLINQKEAELLTNEELTEQQRTAIQIQAEASRKEIRVEQEQDRMLGIETEYNDIATSYDRKQQLINEKEALLLSDATLTENQRTAIQKQASDERVAIALAEKEAKAAIQNAELDLVQQGAGLLKEIAGKNKKLQIAAVIVEQAAAIGKIAVNTGIANAKAIAASPLTFGQPWVAINTISGVLSAATAVAAGVKAIQQINAADSGTPASSAGAVSAPQAAPPTPPSVASAQAPTVNVGVGQNPNTQIAETIGNAQAKPIKTYVVAQEMASQLAFDRRTNNAATL